MKNIIPVKMPERSVVHDFIKEFILTHNLRNGVIIGIGGLEYAEIGYYNPSTRTYSIRKLNAGETTLEVTSLLGNYIVKQDGSVSIHLHATLATQDNVVGGHLVKGVVLPFLEVFLIELDEDLLRVFNHR
jgi:predicted DNA-binding protein with PD1-like motif